MYRKSTYGAEVDPREEEALQLVQEAERLEVQFIFIMAHPHCTGPGPGPGDLLKLIHLGSRFEPVGKPGSGLLLKGLLFNIVFGAYSARKTQMKSYSIFASPHFLLLFLPLSSHFTPQLACAIIATT